MTRLVIVAIAVAFTGCRASQLTSTDASPDPTGPTNGGGSTGAGGGFESDGGSPGLDGAGQAPDTGATTSAAECIEQQTARPGASARVTVNVELSYAGKPVVFGEPFALPTGTLTLTNFRFYVAAVELTPGTGDPVPVDLVGGDGVPVPYNLVLVNAEDPSAMTFQIAAPPGDYQGLSFLVGLPDACNGSPTGNRSGALSYESQMTWPAPFGYLFLRYAGKIAGVPATDTTPSVIDMGGFPRMIFAPRAAVEGRFTAGGSASVQLKVALDELFRAENMPVQLDDIGKLLTSVPTLGDAQLAGQHVLQNLQAVSLFSLTDGP